MKMLARQGVPPGAGPPPLPPLPIAVAPLPDGWPPLPIAAIPLPDGMAAPLAARTGRCRVGCLFDYGAGFTVCWGRVRS